MLYYLRASIVEPKELKSYIIFFVPSMVGVLAFLTGLLFNIAILKMGLVGAIFCLVIANFATKYNIRGEIALTDEEILIARGENNLRIPLSGVQELQITYNAYAGKPMGLKSMIMHDGASNHLNFKFKGQEFKLCLLLESGHVSGLNNLFRLWRQKGVKYALVDRGNTADKIKKYWLT